jgi:hypothetical protein
LITLTPGRRTEFLDCQKSKVRIAVLPIMDVKTRWNSTLELLERAYRLREFTREWLKNPNYKDYRPLFTTDDEWTVVKYVMEVLRPFRYWTLWMSKRHTVTLHHVITLYNDMFDHMDGVLRALAKKKTQWKEDLYFAVKFARKKLSKYYADVTPETGMLLIAAQIMDPFRKLRTFRKWDKGMDTNPEDEESFTAQYKDAFLKYVEREYCSSSKLPTAAKQETDEITDMLSTPPRSGPGQSSWDPYDLSSDDEEYLAPQNVAESTPGRSDRAARLLMATNLYLNSPPETPQKWGQFNPHLNDYLSDPSTVSSTFWTPDITDWWRKQEETHSKYADLANVARDIFSIMPHGVGVEASFSLGRDVIGWRQSKTTGATLREKVVVRQFARSNKGILAGDSSGLGDNVLENNSEIKKAAEETKLHRMASTHDFLEMWQGSEKLRATQKAAKAQNKQMTAMGYISDSEEVESSSWASFAHDGLAAFKSNEKTPLPKSLPLTELQNGKTQVLNVRRIPRINRQPGLTDEESAGEDNTDTEDWLHWDGDMESGAEDESDSSTDDEHEMDRILDTHEKESPEQSHGDAAPNVPGFIRPVRKSKRIVELAVSGARPTSNTNTQKRRGRGNKRR